MELLKEVAPPGFGHTKSGKGDKKGGTAAAFDRARKEGRFKGSKSDMFAIMWSQKNKGDKPHYKPGTKKKYKKYQEETSMPNVDKKDRGAIKKRFKGLFKKDIKGTVAGVNDNIEVTGGFEFQDYDPNMKFREYEFIDIIKAEPLKGAVSEGSDYEKLKKKIGSKEKHNKPVMTFKEFNYLNKYT